LGVLVSMKMASIRISLVAGAVTILNIEDCAAISKALPKDHLPLSRRGLIVGSMKIFRKIEIAQNARIFGFSLDDRVRIVLHDRASSFIAS
jgi:hypothetical protein